MTITHEQNRRQLHTVHFVPKPNLNLDGEKYRFRLGSSFGDDPGSQRHSLRGSTGFLDGIFESQPTTSPLLQKQMGKQISRIRRRANNQRNINVERNYVIIHHTKVPSFETFQKKTRRNKKKTHISENSTFSSYFYLSSECCSTTFDGRFMGFVFVSNTGRAGFAGRAAFHLEPGCLNQRCPEECLEKLIFSLPIHVQNNNNKNHKQ